VPRANQWELGNSRCRENVNYHRGDWFDCAERVSPHLSCISSIICNPSISNNHARQVFSRHGINNLIISVMRSPSQSNFLNTKFDPVRAVHGTYKARKQNVEITKQTQYLLFI
jgi:hypothetical protein